MIKHISIFMPSESTFHKRIFVFLTKSFQKLGLEVSGCCKLLSNEEIVHWIDFYKPGAIFEMNRVKDEIPILYDFEVLHISWVVDMAGRSESEINGSDITYAFDPGWLANFNTNGFLAWMPPGTCVETFHPNSANSKKYEFCFVGHIPRPWGKQELSREIVGKDKSTTFDVILNSYENYIRQNSCYLYTHEDCKLLIDNIVSNLLGEDRELTTDMYYDLLIRTKRMSNREELLNFAVNSSDSVAIYGSENWRIWADYKSYYKCFVDEAKSINLINQEARINLHDGVSFHFRSIDCMASGGVLMWYDNRFSDKYGSLDSDSEIIVPGLSNFFESQFHYYEFNWSNFDEVYNEVKRTSFDNSIAQKEMLGIISLNHTWDSRAKQIITDISGL